MSCGISGVRFTCSNWPSEPLHGGQLSASHGMLQAAIGVLDPLPTAWGLTSACSIASDRMSSIALVYSVLSLFIVARVECVVCNSCYVSSPNTATTASEVASERRVVSVRVNKLHLLPRNQIIPKEYADTVAQLLDFSGTPLLFEEGLERTHSGISFLCPRISA